MEPSDLHRFLETTLNTLSIVFNIVLLYLIRYHSTAQMSTYKQLLTVDASFDLALGFSCLLTQPAYFTGDGFLVAVANGPLAERFPSWSAFMLVAFSLTFVLNFIWTPTQFAYRWIVICGPTKKLSMIWLVAFIFIGWIAIGLAAIYPVHDPPPSFQAVGAEVLRNINWPVLSDGTQTICGAPLKDIRLVCFTLFWVASATVSIAIVVVCERNIFRFLRSFGHTFTDQTRRMHGEFHRALLAMAICPLFTTTAPTLYYCVCMGLSLNPGVASAFVSTAFSSITLLNPLTTVIFMRCYRRVVLGLFRRILGRRHNAVGGDISAIYRPWSRTVSAGLTNTN